eukprot:SAG31_NODE_853_length_11512_cov_42.663279_9_plen_263_part_00
MAVQTPQRAAPPSSAADARALRSELRQLQSLEGVSIEHVSIDHRQQRQPNRPAAEPALDLTPWPKRLCYWLRPPLLFLACGFVQSLLLHYATASYVADMTIFHAQLRLAGAHSTAATAADGRADRVRQSVLYDVLGEAVGSRRAASLALLDLSGVVPMLLFLVGVLLLGHRHSFVVGLWTKTFLVAAALALVKGTFDAVTILPSSDGWDACAQRLGPARFDIVKPGGVLRATLNGANSEALQVARRQIHSLSSAVYASANAC